LDLLHQEVREALPVADPAACLDDRPDAVHTPVPAERLALEW